VWLVLIYYENNENETEKKSSNFFFAMCSICKLVGKSCIACVFTCFTAENYYEMNTKKIYKIKVLSLTYANKLQLKENFLTRNKLESVINFMMHEYRPQLTTQWANCINLLMSTQLWIFKCSFKFFYESANNLFFVHFHVYFSSSCSSRLTPFKRIK